MADATDKMRESFESWIIKDSTLPLDRDAYDYSDFTTALMWHAWQAAREALAQQPAQGEAVGHLYRLIVEGQVVGARYMDGPKLFGVFGKPGRDHGGKETATALYAAPPAPVVPDARPIESWMSDKTAYENYGWNACRAALLASGGKASAQPAPSVPDIFRSVQDAKKNARTSTVEAEYSALLKKLSGRDFYLIHLAMLAAGGKASVPDDALNLVANVIDNLQDMPISEAWAEKTAAKLRVAFGFDAPEPQR